MNGIPTDQPPELGTTFFIRDPQGAWYPNQSNLVYEIESCCLKLYDLFATKVFGDISIFHAFSKSCPEFLVTSGMNSESTLSKGEFEELLNRLPTNEYTYRALYLYDCFKLVSGLQECSKEVMQLQGEFYYSFNFEEFFYPKIEEPDGTRYVTSPVVTKLYAMLGFIYIHLHSLLDYTTKLVFEIEKIKTNFDSYPRLASKNTMYSHKKNTSLDNVSNTIFESCSFINEIEAIRNHVIHNGLLDDLPKAYKVIVQGNCVEKFILLPDRNENGRFESYKNRNLFYSREYKINEKLPAIISEFQNRLVNTLELLLERQAAGIETGS